jgi:hypothetical protein
MDYRVRDYFVFFSLIRDHNDSELYIERLKWLFPLFNNLRNLLNYYFFG